MVRQRKTQTADLLIVNGYNCYTGTNDYLEHIRKNSYAIQMKYFGDLWCNFFISDDGKVIEGIGWDYFNHINNGGLGPRSLIIVFIKKEKDAETSAAAIMAFNELVRTAICKKALSLHYSLVTYYLVYDRYSLGINSSERKEMKKWSS